MIDLSYFQKVVSDDSIIIGSNIDPKISDEILKGILSKYEKNEMHWNKDCMTDSDWFLISMSITASISAYRGVFGVSENGVDGSILSESKKSIKSTNKGTNDSTKTVRENKNSSHVESSENSRTKTGEITIIKDEENTTNTSKVVDDTVNETREFDGSNVTTPDITIENQNGSQQSPMGWNSLQDVDYFTDVGKGSSKTSGNSTVTQDSDETFNRKVDGSTTENGSAIFEAENSENLSETVEDNGSRNVTVTDSNDGSVIDVKNIDESQDVEETSTNVSELLSLLKVPHDVLTSLIERCIEKFIAEYLIIY